MNPSYNPSLAALIANTDNEWGDPLRNFKNLIFYNIKHFDDALFGIDMDRGELIAVQAREKNRKTTFALNVVYNFAHQILSKGHDWWVCYEILESGQTPSAIRDSFLAMSGTRHLIAGVYGPNPSLWPDIKQIKANPTLEKELILSKEFMWYGTRTTLQKEAIEKAKATLSRFPISVFGASIDQGNARDLDATLERWHLLYNGQYQGNPNKHRIFVADNLQLYSGFGSRKFDQLETVVAALAGFIVTHPGSVLLAISQVSLGSVRVGEFTAKGGTALAAEATVMVETAYDRDVNPYELTIRVPTTRKKAPPTLIQQLEPESGAFIGEARPSKTL